MWLATDPAITPATGGYWYHRRTEATHKAAHDGAFQARLLDALARRTGVELD